MDRKYIDDNHVVARYLADQLSDAEREAFEAYYLAHPQVVQEMEAAARLKVGLAQLKQSGELDSLLRHKPWFRQERYLAFAASVAIVVLGAFLFIHRGPTSQPALAASAAVLVDRLGDPLPTLGTFTILRTRSASYDAEIELPATAQSIALRVLPESEAQPALYRVSLLSVARDNTTHEVAAIGQLSPDAGGFVPVYLNSARLAAGRYELVIQGDSATSAGNEASSFLINVLEPPAPPQ